LRQHRSFDLFALLPSFVGVFVVARWLPRVFFLPARRLFKWQR
jgi:hypothetical protein